MYCRKCGCQIDDMAMFCSRCGERVADQTIYNTGPAEVTGETAGWAQSPSPNYNYQSAYYDGMQYPAAPVNAIGNQPLISKGGYIAAIIFSSVSLMMFLLNVIKELVGLTNGTLYSVPILDILQFLFCCVPFFIFCLLLKKAPAVLTAIPLLYFLVERMLTLLSSLMHFPLFGTSYGYTPLSVSFLFVLVAGIVMYFITLRLKSRPKVMKIITMVLLVKYALFLLINLVYYSLNTISYFDITWIFYDLGLCSLFAAMIVILFTSKPKIN